MFALFAGVQCETAFRALADWVGEILQQRSTFGATGDGPSSGHVDGPRPECVLFLRGNWLLKFLFWTTARTGVLVAALPILAVGQKAPPENVGFYECEVFNAARYMEAKMIIVR